MIKSSIIQRIFIPLAMLFLLLQTVGAWPEKFQTKYIPSPVEGVNEPEEDRDWIHHRAPDDPPHKLQPRVLVLDEMPMNEPEEDRDMIHHGSSDIHEQDLLPEDSSLNHAIAAQQEHPLKMVLPPEPINEPGEDQNMIHHGF
ncbi:uncharacterized protein [Narcine bancroftii]|uniref:uncharacterized protein n=1 Tax=Narcine bancroftii TaxID=1343680 RepID=UPI00383151C6